MSIRHNFSERTKRILGARAGWRCSNPDCRAKTSGPTIDKDHASNIGVAAHINAAAPRGPRYEPLQQQHQRQGIANAIWLCQTCAKAVDDDPERYDAPTLRYWRQDAESLADWEKGRAVASVHSIRFAAIQIDPRSLWWPAHRLNKAWASQGVRADFGFHQIPRNAWRSYGLSARTHSLDPILDFTLVNDSSNVTIISAIGFEPVSAWSALKGIPLAYKVRAIDTYCLSVQAIELGHSQMLALSDPIAVRPSGVGRIKLCLKGYGKALRGNESLIRIQVVADMSLWKSRLIYMGTY